MVAVVPLIAKGSDRLTEPSRSRFLGANHHDSRRRPQDFLGRVRHHLESVTPLTLASVHKWHDSLHTTLAQCAAPVTLILDLAHPLPKQHRIRRPPISLLTPCILIHAAAADQLRHAVGSNTFQSKGSEISPWFPARIPLWLAYTRYGL